MSKGKYSPHVIIRDYSEYVYNAHGRLPAPWNPEIAKNEQYQEEVHFANYDLDGFDSYGYSAFDKNNNFVGGGNGVDKAGYTELDYMGMADEEFNDL